MNITPCPDCTTAALRQHHIYSAACNGCKARAIARSPVFNAAKTGGMPADKDSYRLVLMLTGVTHVEVMAAASADRLCDLLKNGPP